MNLLDLGTFWNFLEAVWENILGRLVGAVWSRGEPFGSLVGAFLEPSRKLSEGLLGICFLGAFCEACASTFWAAFWEPFQTFWKALEHLLGLGTFWEPFWNWEPKPLKRDRDGHPCRGRKHEQMSLGLGSLPLL